MTRWAPPDDAKARMRRRRRAADTARWRSRCRRGVQLFQLEAGPTEYDLAIRYGGLKKAQISNKAAVNAALGRLLRRALTALLREGKRRR
jgi:hypothetical protein